MESKRKGQSMAKKKKARKTAHRKASKPGKAKAAAKEAIDARTKAEATGRATGKAQQKALKAARSKSVRGGFWKGVIAGDELIGNFVAREWGTGKVYKNKQLNILVDTGEGVVTFSAASWLGETFEREYPKVKAGQAIAIVYKGEGTRSGRGRPPKLYSISMA